MAVSDVYCNVVMILDLDFQIKKFEVSSNWTTIKPGKSEVI